MSNYHDHDGIAMRWVDRAYYGQQFGAARKGANLHDEGDIIYSYGHHFEVARILRDSKRRPVGWLLNGNRFSNTTNKHQAAVRNAIAREEHRLPAVTIPHAALDAAGIDYATVQIIDVQADWWTEREERRFDRPASWVTRESTTEIGGWRNTLTGEYVSRVSYWGPDAVSRPKVECDHILPEPVGPWRPGYNWHRDAVATEARTLHERLRHGQWEEVPAITRSTGRVRIQSSTNVEWEIVDDPESPIGVAYTRTVRRHWLGASLIRAAINEPIMRRHQRCGGTGQVEPWLDYLGLVGEGPLDEEGMARHRRHEQFVMERNGGIRQPVGYHVEAYGIQTHCRLCNGTGRMRGTRRRWAYYLSGFDQNETRPSYFFCELPKSSPTTVDEAYEVLKPDAVKLAEQMGRDVKRQGDIFAIPMPNADLRLMKKNGGVHTVKPKLIEHDGRLVWSGERPNLLGTNHEAAETVLYRGQLYARGTIIHNPQGRRPDHKRVPLGKQWHLIVKNTVPIGV